jgi:hypothetical protein
MVVGAGCFSGALLALEYKLAANEEEDDLEVPACVWEWCLICGTTKVSFS